MSTTVILSLATLAVCWALPAQSTPDSPRTVSCPQSCTCRHAQPHGHLTVDCSNRGLAEIPTDLDITTVHLDLSANNIQRVPADILPRYVSLQTVKLNDNWLSEIEPKAFRGLRLRSLDLSRNNLVTLSGESLAGVGGRDDCSSSQPCVLNLLENHMRTVESYSLSWIKGLSILLGNSSRDLTIEAYAFYGAENISLISIGNMPALFLEPRVFTNTNSLRQLLISKTDIKPLQKFTFEGLRNIDKVIFSNCHFESIDEFSFSGITYMPETYLHQRSMQEIPDYTLPGGGGNLTISGSSVNKFQEDTFRDTNLKSIVLSNNHIGAIEGQAFRGLNDLTLLELSGNKIGYLETEALGSLKNVPHIKLSQNDIGVIEEHVFRESNGIDKLSIHLRPYTNLTFGSYSFAGLRDIGLLELKGAPGSHLEVAQDAFHDLGGVSVFHVSNLSLPVLGQHTFRGLSKVQTIKFEYCNISKVNAAAFGEPRATGAMATIELNDGNNLPCDCDTNRLLRDFESRFSEFTVTCFTESGEPRVLTEDTLDWPSCNVYSAAPSWQASPSLGLLLVLTVFIMNNWYCSFR